MAKSNPLSIYLLKSSYNPSNTLKTTSMLERYNAKSDIPKDFALYLTENKPKNPWWVDYFNIEINFSQSTKSALIFAPINNRVFALSFGYAYNDLKNESYEYDFGIRTKLNCIDSEKLKIMETSKPTTSYRKETRIPNSKDITMFDFDEDSNLLNSLTGLVKEEHKEIFQNSTGTNNLKFKTPYRLHQLKSLLKHLLELYQSEDYLLNFPGIYNIRPVKNIKILTKLDKKLLTSIKQKDKRLHLSLPRINNNKDVDSPESKEIVRNETHDDVSIDNFHNQWKGRGKSIENATLEDLKKPVFKRINPETNKEEKYSVYECFVYHTQLDDEKDIYYLLDGKWLMTNAEFVTEMKEFLDPLCKTTTLPDFNHENEHDYNTFVEHGGEFRYLCLDRTNIAPDSYPEVEPCNLYSTQKYVPTFIHVKRSTQSKNLDDLFNQALNSAECILLFSESLNKLETLIHTHENGHSHFTVPSSEDKFKVVFALITYKDKTNLSANLPLNSCLSLKRTLKALISMDIDVSFEFVAEHKELNPRYFKTKKIYTPNFINL